MLMRKANHAKILHDMPAARSYDGNIWEPLFPLLINVQCNAEFAN